MSGAIELSIVSPVYQSEDSVAELVRQILQSTSSLAGEVEIVLVEDGSMDGSWKEIEKCAASDSRVKAVKLSRNFGQHYAITAGIRASRGQYVVVMDCDLQDDPRFIPDLYRRAREGFDIILARRQIRRFPLWKEVLSKTFYLFFGWLAERKDSQYNTGVFGSYSLISRKTADAFLQLTESHRHYILGLRWLGFSTGYVDVVHQARPHGKSSYTLRKLIAHALDGVVSHSDKLLHLSVTLGFALGSASFASIIYLIVRYYMFGFKEGWTSLIVIVLGSTGLILFFLGIAGIYIGKIYEQSKQRPLYLIDRTINL